MVSTTADDPTPEHPLPPPPRPPRPTGHDVALSASVSQATVSMVMTGNWVGRVSAATATRVQDAARELGYRPNEVARQLRGPGTTTVLMIVPVLGSAFFASIHTAAVMQAGERGISVVVYPLAASDERTALPFTRTAVDGVLACSVDPPVARERVGEHLPLVMLDSDPAHPFTTVSLDLDDGMDAVAEHLASLGHRRIAHLASDREAWTFRRRREALDLACLRRGVEVTRIPSRPTVRAGYDAMARFLQERDRPTAVVCDTDKLADAAYLQARSAGLAVPDDLSIVGIDDPPTAELLRPSITTLRLPADELGQRGIDALLATLDGAEVPSVVLPTQLVIRDSTAAPGPR